MGSIGGRQTADGCSRRSSSGRRSNGLSRARNRWPSSADELDIAPSVIRNWKRFADAGATTAVQASEYVVPASQLREAYAKIRELERALAGACGVSATAAHHAL